MAQLVYEGLTDTTLDIIKNKCRAELIEAYTALEKEPHDQITPKLKYLFHPFRVCPIEKARVIVIGQDPYPKAGDSMGMSFSTFRHLNKVPASLANIYKCLHKNNLISEKPIHGDLTDVAKQGVIFMNATLTTLIGKSNSHVKIWAKYTTKLIESIVQYHRENQLIFILLGVEAQKKYQECFMPKGKNIVLEWGHPSPISTANKNEKNEKAFINCDVFNRANEYLAPNPIDWNCLLDGDEVVNGKEEGRNLYIFTDAACSGNGKANCRSAWAYIAIEGDNIIEKSGKVSNANVDGADDKNSNNRGELTAMQQALTVAYEKARLVKYTTIYIISDSKYCVETMRWYVDSWLKLGKAELNKKKNLDIIMPMKKMRDEIASDTKIKFRHVNSHTAAPEKTSNKWFCWYYNDCVDKLCGKELNS